MSKIILKVYRHKNIEKKYMKKYVRANLVTQRDDVDDDVRQMTQLRNHNFWVTHRLVLHVDIGIVTWQTEPSSPSPAIRLVGESTPFQRLTPYWLFYENVERAEASGICDVSF